MLIFLKAVVFRVSIFPFSSESIYSILFIPNLRQIFLRPFEPFYLSLNMCQVPVSKYFLLLYIQIFCSGPCYLHDFGVCSIRTCILSFHLGSVQYARDLQ